MKLIHDARQWALQAGYKQTVDACDADSLASQIEQKEVYVCEYSDIMGSFSLHEFKKDVLLEYELVPDSPVDVDNGLVLYRLIVSRKHKGMRLGYIVLDKACEVVHSLGGSILYLDCWAGNVKLRAYYISAGFAFMGIARRKDDENYRIALFSRYC
jgi:ribosomal protein S18 acetylase RimI-like enzyme